MPPRAREDSFTTSGEKEDKKGRQTGQPREGRDCRTREEASGNMLTLNTCPNQPEPEVGWGRGLEAWLWWTLTF